MIAESGLGVVFRKAFRCLRLIVDFCCVFNLLRLYFHFFVLLLSHLNVGVDNLDACNFAYVCFRLAHSLLLSSSLGHGQALVMA